VSIEEASAEMADKARKRVERELNDLRFVLSYPEGRRVMWKILSEAGVFRGSWTGVASSTDHNEGKRYIGLGILETVMKARPEAFLQMMNDSESERIKDEAEMKKAEEAQ